MITALIINIVLEQLILMGYTLGHFAKKLWANFLSVSYTHCTWLDQTIILLTLG